MGGDMGHIHRLWKLSKPQTDFEAQVPLNAAQTRLPGVCFRTELEGALFKQPSYCVCWYLNGALQALQIVRSVVWKAAAASFPITARCPLPSWSAFNMLTHVIRDINFAMHISF
jgi:hypothetical protein